MYLSYFGLTEKPFNITPDPRFLFMSEQHREALAHLLFSTDERSSFIVLTGEVGTGKTTLCRSMLESGVEGNHFALILNPMQSPVELLASACDEFGINYPDTPGIKALVDALNDWLLTLNAHNEQAILVIDEAQNLSFDTLEQIRLLTNLETGQKKLLKIILIGQPQLQEILQRPDLQQLAQRVTARFHLNPMNAIETRQYLQHRLKIAGITRELFSTQAMNRLFKLSCGIPRKINLIADRALMGAYAHHQDRIDTKLVVQAAREVSLPLSHNRHNTRRLILASSLVILLAMAFWRLNTASVSIESQTNSTTTRRVLPALDTATYVNALKAEFAAEEKPIPPAVRPDPPKTRQPSPISTLFSLWGIQLDPQSTAPACDQAREDRLECLYQSGSVHEFLRFNRPAIIELIDESGNPVQQLIKTVADNEFTVMRDEGERIIDRATLSNHWPGKFLTLWHAPPSGNTAIIAGSPEDDIIWLWQQFQTLALIPPTLAPPEQLNSRLASAIRQFQQNQGLQIDGIAGMRTLLALEKAIYPDSTPLLDPNRKGASH